MLLLSSYFDDCHFDYLENLDIPTLLVADDVGSHLIKSFKFVFCSLEGTCIQ